MPNKRSGSQALGQRSPLQAVQNARGIARRSGPVLQHFLHAGVDRANDRRARQQNRRRDEKASRHRLLDRAGGDQQAADRNKTRDQRETQQHDVHRFSLPKVEARSVAPPRFPHYRLEEPRSGLCAAQTLAGYRVVHARDADTFSTYCAALIAAGAAPLDIVRVDA
jgi:hypothetical protein